MLLTELSLPREQNVLNGQWVGLLSTDLCEPLVAKTESKQPPSGIAGIFCLAAFSLQFCKRLSMGVLLYCCWRLHLRGFQVPQTFSAQGAHTKHKGTHPPESRKNMSQMPSIYDMEMKKNHKRSPKKVLIFKINLCDKIFSYSSAYALICWNPYLKHWAALLYLREGERTEKRRKKRASVFLLSLPPQYFTPHTHWGYHSAALVSICGNYIFSCRFFCWMDASLYCIFALRARCWYYLIWIPIANICLASGQWPRAEMMISADCAPPIDGLKK